MKRHVALSVLALTALGVVFGFPLLSSIAMRHVGAVHASEMYARNLFNFLSAFWDKDAGKPVLPDDDEITAAIRLTQGGKVVHERLLGS